MFTKLSIIYFLINLYIYFHGPRRKTKKTNTGETQQYTVGQKTKILILATYERLNLFSNVA